jgi:hypothetical protein
MPNNNNFILTLESEEIMDSFDSGPKPQFNCVYFGRKIHVQTNEKFCNELIRFINANEELLAEWSWLAVDIRESLNGEPVILNGTKPVIVKVGSTIEFFLELDEAANLAADVLDFAGMVSQQISDFPLNSFVAFGRRLKSAADGDFTKPINKGRQSVREIIVERRVLR